MKTLISMLAMALALAFAGPSFAQDVTNREDCRRLRQSRWSMGCCDQYVRREKDVSVIVCFHAAKGRRLRSAPFSIPPP